VHDNVSILREKKAAETKSCFPGIGMLTEKKCIGGNGGAQWRGGKTVRYLLFEKESGDVLLVIKKREKKTEGSFTAKFGKKKKQEEEARVTESKASRLRNKKKFCQGKKKVAKELIRFKRHRQAGKKKKDQRKGT